MHRARVKVVTGMSTRTKQGIPTDVWADIERRCPRMEFADGDALMHHGSPGRGCFAILDGTVLVTTASTQGSTVVLARRGAGDLVGELATLTDSPRTATVTARGPVVAHALRRDDLLELLEEHPAWSVELLVVLADRLRTITQRYSVRSEDLRHRVCDLLATHLDETGDPSFRSTREELAGWVGATREATARVLHEMKSDGLVRLGRGVVTVVDRNALAV